jgi:hypothetical protein
MTINDLKSKLNREPFHPFVIELASGRQIAIGADSEMFFPKARPDLVIAFMGNGLQHEFETSAITSLIEA